LVFCFNNERIDGQLVHKNIEMKIRLKKLMTLILLITISCYSQKPYSFTDIRLGDTLEEVSLILDDLVDSMDKREINPPVFPLSEKKDVHLFARKIELVGGTLDKAVFIFSDHKLAYVEAIGDVEKIFSPTQTGEGSDYMTYTIYRKKGIVISKKTKTIWILNSESMHANLFTWNHPMLLDLESTFSYNNSAKIPDFLSMGASYSKLVPEFRKRSRFVKIDTLNGSDANAPLA
jgi:hypothetical protein